MAEVKVTAPDLNKCDHDDTSSSTLMKSTDFEMDRQLPNHESNLVHSESKIKTDYLENLLDIPDENLKENFKEKVGPQLQETQPNHLNNISDLIVAGTSTENVGLNYHNQIDEDSTLNKIQNVDSSVAALSSVPFSNIATDTVNTENITSGDALNSGTVPQTMQSSCNQDYNNASGLFTSTTDTTYQNNQEQMNNSLKLICDYGSDSDIDDIIEMGSAPEASIIGPSENAKSFLNDYRTAQVLFSEDSDDDSDSSDEKSDSDSSTSSSNSSSSTSSSSSSVNAENASALRRVVNNNEQNNTPRPKKKDPIKTRGEILIEDLPPIQDLQINVPAEDCIQLGKISSIVDQLVVVQAFKNTPPLDLDSILFLDHGRQTLGQIFDVFGPVSEPLYCVRFNSTDHIKEKGIEKDMAVYCAPKTQHTSYVFVPDLLRIKGSDASWEDNNEPPPRFLDYSDDEGERRARRSLQLEERKVTDESPEQPKKKKNRSSSFERRMNERNLRMTALHANKPATVAIRNGNNNNNSNSNPFQPFDNSTWWTGPIPPTPRFQHCLSRPPPPPCTPSAPRLIQPPAFTLPPPTAPPFFPSIQPPFLPYNQVFPPPVPPFDPNRPPPSFGFPPPMPQMPQRHPPL
ncbi:hypothetical protein B7P43_G04336 [Cryptotermes secundus]|uniref:H/ACA ribonucleoprotein complex non-core subunit NAF1 n=2 Tax=Cryptotermes secundus TaxID=105785 RepID=A0A2J7QW79_9NEOP|nr:H/ACA ribonucleoprotein complex non-core subunit NAF1 isoform X2 [Cryptotermes secundus]XP_023708357.1 H/ACA ribonucleoprotein complex non-core subunit NAF1 isoform X2 [Cryptotermes secundus]XP_023708358.1 H/ACA ribonucleoprotein complex non-core subunit NAF1 isoform X2 [Cryptotermes secundus]XP_023708359.1 H/ACA ribonucleoprotein complex non-core subunit NAF1 isoform X2 [Cryptotermes secundus]PNF32837.1 hypothetical protein B7P43_G04336 [Cryptotermes secundus]PNF32839.1 hypothetical protei